MPFHQTLFDRISEGGNRLFGAPQGLLSPEEQRFMQQRGLLGLGSSLLRSSGPSTEPVGLGQAIGEAIPQGQAQAFQGLQQQDFLQQRQAAQQAAQARAQTLRQATEGERLDFNNVVQKLLKSGEVGTAGEIADIANKLSTEGARLQFMKMDDGTIVALDPFSGEKRAEIGMQIGDKIVTLNPEQFRLVDTVRDDFIREAQPFLDQSNAFSRLGAAATDLRAAIQGNKRQEASAAADMLITQFVLLGEPRSVVRDPEFRRAATTGGVPQRVESILEGLFSGTLSVDVLNSIARQGDLQFQQAGKQYNEVFLPPARQRLEDAGINGKFLREPNPWKERAKTQDLDIPEPFVPPRTFEPSFVERMFSGFGTPKRGASAKSAIDELMDEAAEIRRRIAEFRGPGRDALTPFENR